MNTEICGSKVRYTFPDGSPLGFPIECERPAGHDGVHESQTYSTIWPQLEPA